VNDFEEQTLDKFKKFTDNIEEAADKKISSIEAKEQKMIE